MKELICVAVVVYVSIAGILTAELYMRLTQTPGERGVIACPSTPTSDEHAAAFAVFIETMEKS